MDILLNYIKNILDFELHYIIVNYYLMSKGIHISYTIKQLC